MVVTEGELDGVLDDLHFGVESPEGFPSDPLSIWADTLDKHNLGIDRRPDATSARGVRHIADGDQRPVLRPPAIPQLDPAEEAVSSDRLANIAIRGFREYPVQKTFDFGAVNLILGATGSARHRYLKRSSISSAARRDERGLLFKHQCLRIAGGIEAHP